MSLDRARWPMDAPTHVAGASAILRKRRARTQVTSHQAIAA